MHNPGHAFGTQSNSYRPNLVKKQIVSINLSPTKTMRDINEEVEELLI